jgi:hypothetical protein
MEPVQYWPVPGLVRVACVRVVLVAIPFVLTACVDTMGPVPRAYYGSQRSARSCPPPAPLGERDATLERDCTAWASGPPARKTSR